MPTTGFGGELHPRSVEELERPRRGEEPVGSAAYQMRHDTWGEWGRKAKITIVGSAIFLAGTLFVSFV